MAGHAICLRINTEGFDEETGMVFVQYQCLFHDAGLGVNEPREAIARFAPDATPGQIENAIEDAILASRDTYYPTMTLAKSDMIFLDVKRGAA